MRVSGRILGVVVSIFAYSCSPAPSATACAPGQSIACTGPVGCAGYQVCKADGSGYEACDCGAGTSSTSAGSGGSSSTGVGAGTSSSTGTGGGGGDGGIADLAPDQIPGLVLWLDSSKGTIPDGTYPQLVSIWTDQSIHGNNAHDSAWQQEPVLQKSGFKSFDVLKFEIGGSGKGMQITDDASLQFGTGDFAIVLVVSEPSVQFATLWQKGAPGGLQITADVNINVLTPNAEAHAFLPNPQSFHVVAVRGADLEIRIDGVPSKGAKSTTSLDAVGADAWMGAGGFANDFAEIDYLQLIAYKGKVTDSEIAGLESYLKNKYGL